MEFCRLYALLHDIGHLPLSHLFEMAVESWAGKPQEIVAEEWSGVTGFKKLHEAFGAAIVKQMVQGFNLPKPVRNAFVKVTAEKELPLKHPLSIVKQLVDFDIDADRIDFVARDGLLAGGEYGHYDIRRLCDSVFIEQDKEGWGIVYSEKALTSMEALFLDRYRTHVWIHFHHRVVAMKMLVRFLIEKALERKLIRKEHFNPSKVEAFALRDDVWLWNVLREMPTNGDRTLEMVKHAVFYREKRNTLNLWKTRPGYHALQRRVTDKAHFATLVIKNLDAYCRYLSRRMKVHVLGFEPPFEVLSEKAVMLYSEEEKRGTNNEIRKVSRLVAGLTALWEDDPQLYIFLVGKNAKSRRKELRSRWIKETAEWIRNPRLL